MRVGVVGYSTQKFDVKKAIEIIREVFDDIARKYGNNITIVSGLTAMGIPLLAYKEAKRRGWKTVGVTCEKANEYEQFPVDEKIIVGEEWGDESETFLSMIDVLVRIGGGKQSHKETQMAKERGISVIEYDL